MNDRQATRIKEFLQKECISDRDRAFANSLLRSAEKYSTLTSRQWGAFQQMSHRYDPATIARHHQWRENFGDLERRDLLIVATYYQSQKKYTWYNDLAEKILADPEFIPTEKQYNALVNNKYAHKILSGTQATPAFERGSLVQFRKCEGIPRTLHNRLAIVVANDLPVLSAARGNKAYAILPFGTTHTQRVEERHLKKPRGSKKHG
jgi:hypothetical protein